jgi:pimeloyl-ACP methyl ester carboxylesterase
MLSWIHCRRKAVRAGLVFTLARLALAGFVLLVGMARVYADGPAKDSAAVNAVNVSTDSTRSVAAVAPPADLVPAGVSASTPAPIVIGFVGGFIRHDDAVHSTVILARNLQREYAGAVHVETFENRRVSDARALVLRLLAAGHPDGPTDEQRRGARIILYGHSWGASAALVLARELQADRIPVLLTVQVDSVAKLGNNDAVIPGNVEHAANFYQTNGFPRGQQHIQAADAKRTEILGNFRLDYDAKPVSCPDYPWIARTFMRTHIEIECDPAVWRHVEELIRAELPATAKARNGVQ